MSDPTDTPKPEGSAPQGAQQSPDPDKILQMLEVEMRLSREKRLASEKKQRSSVTLIALLVGFLFFIIAASFVMEGFRDAVKQQQPGGRLPAVAPQPSQTNEAPTPGLSNSPDVSQTRPK